MLLRFCGSGAVLAGVLLLAGEARSQEADASTIHWAYSTWFGTGWYQIGSERDAFSILYAPRKPVRGATLEEDGSRTVGIELRLPITVGLNHFPLDDLRGSLDPENLANISVTPSVYFDVLMSERWTLRPFIALGWGTVLNGSESAWTYWSGVRSRLAFEAGDWDAALLHSIGFVGYSPSVGPSSNFWPITTAVELARPMGKLEHKGRQLVLHPHVAYTFFQADLDIVRRDRGTEPIRDQWEFGLAVSKEESKIRIWRFEFERLGLVYRFSSDGELQGIGFVFRSLFDQ